MNQITPIYKPEYESYSIILKTPYQTNIQKIEFQPNNTLIENPLIINKDIYYTLIFNDGEEFLVKITSENNKLYLNFDEPLNLTNDYVVDTEIQTLLYSKNGNKSNETITISDIKNNPNLVIDTENNLNQGLISKDIYNKILNIGDKVKIIDNKQISFDSNKKSILFVVNYYENDEFTLILKDLTTFECSLSFKIKANREIEVIKNYVILSNNTKLSPKFLNFTLALNYLDFNKFGILLDNIWDNFVSGLNIDLYRKANVDFKTLYINDDTFDINEWNSLYPNDKLVFEKLPIDVYNNQNIYVSSKDNKETKSFDFKLFSSLKNNETLDLNKFRIDEGYFRNIIFHQDYTKASIILTHKPADLNETGIRYLFYQKLFVEEKLIVFFTDNTIKTWYRYDLNDNWKLDSLSLRAEDIITSNDLQFISLEHKNKIEQLFNVTNLTESKPQISISGLKIKDGDANSVLLANGNSIKIKDFKQKVIIIPRGSISNSTSDTYTITFDDSIKNQFGLLFNVTLFEFVGEE